jgi:hypothetical protein
MTASLSLSAGIDGFGAKIAEFASVLGATRRMQAEGSLTEA